MKPSKSESIATLFSILLVSLLLSFFVGCQTTGVKPTTTTTDQSSELAARARKAAAIVETSAQLGVYYAVRQDKNTLAYFQAAVGVIDILINTGAYDPRSIQESLAHISIKELRGDDVGLAVAAAVALYQNFFGEVVGGQIEQVTYLKPVLQALRDGIAKGVGTQETERKFGLPPKRIATEGEGASSGGKIVLTEPGVIRAPELESLSH